MLEGEAHRITDGQTLERIAAIYQELGWPAEVAGDGFIAPYSAPSAGPPPWHLYRFAFRDAVGVGAREPHGSTHWHVDR